jgi:ubiquinone/menaquinone biosynthesis C-methylase UbiE
MTASDPHDEPGSRRPTTASGEVTDRLRSLWEQCAPRYDRDTSFYDLLLLGDSRSWACSQASGQVLEVAIGTGRNCPSTRGIHLTGIDFSPAMLALARDRAAELGIDVISSKLTPNTSHSRTTGSIPSSAP